MSFGRLLERVHRYGRLRAVSENATGYDGGANSAATEEHAAQCYRRLSLSAVGLTDGEFLLRPIRSRYFVPFADEHAVRTFL
ncbi:hypothetical protein NO113_19260, partial [Clostridioides difficile]|uniref:hypothetical protein n=1 Tax=Clostridioides difficile TaxID=1496 RepID=UPI00210B5DFD